MKIIVTIKTLRIIERNNSDECYYTLKCISSVSIPLLYNRSIELPSFWSDKRIGIALMALRIKNFFNSSKSSGCMSILS
jgi:hypothetical protein